VILILASFKVDILSLSLLCLRRGSTYAVWMGLNNCLIASRWTRKTSHLCKCDRLDMLHYGFCSSVRLFFRFSRTGF